ncbi:MAG: dihydrofolate reductase [Oscillospiraceae bacterium]|nr:dihydrofolate reductase [Oscillospiraceae bacterium]
MDAVVAVYNNWGIGRGGTQPLVIPEDRRFFRELTRGAALIAGRRTLEDFPDSRPLKGRVNIILTRTLAEIEGALIARCAQEALALAAAHEPAFVIGGESVYRALLPYCRSVYVTKIFARPDCDAFFPNLDESGDWRLARQGETREHEGIGYAFARYERSDAKEPEDSSAGL